MLSMLLRTNIIINDYNNYVGPTWTDAIIAE